MNIELDNQEVSYIKKLLEKQIKSIEWVKENKNPTNLEVLAWSVDMCNKLLAKLG